MFKAEVPRACSRPEWKEPRRGAGARQLHHRDCGIIVTAGLFDYPDHAPGSRIHDHAPVIDIGIRIVAVLRDRVDAHGPRQRLPPPNFLSAPTTEWRET